MSCMFKTRPAILFGKEHTDIGKTGVACRLKLTCRFATCPCPIPSPSQPQSRTNHSCPHFSRRFFGHPKTRQPAPANLVRSRAAPLKAPMNAATGEWQLRRLIIRYSETAGSSLGVRFYLHHLLPLWKDQPACLAAFLLLDCFCCLIVSVWSSGLPVWSCRVERIRLALRWLSGFCIWVYSVGWVFRLFPAYAFWVFLCLAKLVARFLHFARSGFDLGFPLSLAFQGEVQIVFLFSCS